MRARIPPCFSTDFSSPADTNSNRNIMAWNDTQNLDPKWTWLTGILTIFFCWMAQEIMERGCGMAPQIRLASEIQEIAQRKSNPLKSFKMNKRMTKQLDHTGRFRITTRGTIYYIKGVWCVLLLIASITIFIACPDWFVQHFIELDDSTVHFWPYQHISASIAAIYSWEVVANRYGKLNYSILIHHWLTVMASILILLGVYTPFATWYGFTQVACLFSIDFILGFRATYSNKYADLTRKAFICSVWWVSFTIVCNFAGQFYLLVNGFVTGRIAVSSCITMLFTMVGWMYDDQLLLRALYDFSTHQYELADLYRKDSPRASTRVMGGVRWFIIDYYTMYIYVLCVVTYNPFFLFCLYFIKLQRLLFAMSVIHDLDMSKRRKKHDDMSGNEMDWEDQSPSSIDVPQHKMLKQVALHDFAEMKSRSVDTYSNVNTSGNSGGENEDDPESALEVKDIITRNKELRDAQDMIESPKNEDEKEEKVDLDMTSTTYRYPDTNGHVPEVTVQLSIDITDTDENENEDELMAQRTERVLESPPAILETISKLGSDDLVDLVEIQKEMLMDALAPPKDDYDIVNDSSRAPSTRL